METADEILESMQRRLTATKHREESHSAFILAAVQESEIPSSTDATISLEAFADHSNGRSLGHCKTKASKLEKVGKMFNSIQENMHENFHRLARLGDDKERKDADEGQDGDYEAGLPPRKHGATLTTPLCRVENQWDTVEEDMSNTSSGQVPSNRGPMLVTWQTTGSEPSVTPSPLLSR